MSLVWQVIGPKSLKDNYANILARLGIATVLEVYENPSGYELECSDSDGITIWLGGYFPEDLSLELVVEGK